MTSNDIQKIKERLTAERERIQRLNSSLQDPQVKEYLKLKGIKEKTVYTIDEWQVISEFLKGYETEDPTNIYVCTGATLTECDICYQETNYYERKCSIYDPYLEYREYKNIETGAYVKAYYDIRYVRPYARKYAKLISDFEKDVIVLHPCKTDDPDNGYEQVRKYYFETALKYGEEVAEDMVLRKYPKVLPYKGAKRYF